MLDLGLYKDRKHPIYNFVFVYFFFSPKVLFRYSPGIGKTLNGVDSGNSCHRESLWHIDTFVDGDGSYTPCPVRAQLPQKQVESLRSTLKLLQAIQSRPPAFWCFGLHEWAMVYKNTSNRFQQLPLRVPQEVVGSLVESKRLRCTHYDALRFFDPAARPLNSISPEPTRRTTHLHDQPGCIHVNMDLFKWAVKAYPFVSSSLLCDALALALRAREIDMRASPYDLSAYTQPSGERGLGSMFSSNPVRVETAEGRKEYQKLQEELYLESVDIRARLVDCYQQILTDLS